jgi:hypothetical protein
MNSSQPHRESNTRLSARTWSPHACVMTFSVTFVACGSWHGRDPPGCPSFDDGIDYNAEHNGTSPREQIQ